MKRIFILMIGMALCLAMPIAASPPAETGQNYAMATIGGAPIKAEAVSAQPVRFYVLKVIIMVFITCGIGLLFAEAVINVLGYNPRDRFQALARDQTAEG